MASSSQTRQPIIYLQCGCTTQYDPQVRLTGGPRRLCLENVDVKAAVV